MVVWMMALSDTLLGPSAWVAAITSSLEGFSLKMSLSESALFVSSGSLFVNFRKRIKHDDTTSKKKEQVCLKQKIQLSHQIEAVLLERSAEDGRIRLYILQGGVIGGFHLYGGSHIHALCNPLEQAQLNHSNILLLPKDSHTPENENAKQKTFSNYWNYDFSKTFKAAKLQTKS